MRLFLLFLLTAGLQLQAATRYVATYGSTSNTGATTNNDATGPWPSWQYAMQHISGGDTLYVLSGTYTERAIHYIGTYTYNGSSTAPPSGPNNATRTLVSSYPGHWATLILTNSSANHWHMSGCSNITLQNFTLDFLPTGSWSDGDWDGMKLNGNSTGDYSVNISQNITISNISILNVQRGMALGIEHGSGSKGAHWGGTMVNIQVLSCTFSNWAYAAQSATDAAPHAIYWFGASDSVIRGCRSLKGANFYGRGGGYHASAFQFYPFLMGSSSNVLCENNFISEGEEGIVISSTVNSTFRNNVIAGMTYLGLSVRGPGYGNVFANNTFLVAPAAGHTPVYNFLLEDVPNGTSEDLSWSGPAHDNYFNNNIWWASAHPFYFNPGNGANYFSNNIANVGPEGSLTGQSFGANKTGLSAYPQFISTNTPFAQANFALAGNSSPAYDAGRVTAGFATDIIGTSRPQGSAWDIGAYEYIVGGPPPRTMAISRVSQSSLTVSLSPPDSNGQSSGTPYFTALYPDLTSITLTAPATDSNGNAFLYWTLDGVQQPSNPITFTISADSAAVAYYAIPPSTHLQIRGKATGKGKLKSN